MHALASALLVVALAGPVATAQDLTGQWAGTFAMQGPDGSTRDQEVHLDLTQKGKTLTGVAGPTLEQQWKIEKGVVDGAKVNFVVQTDTGLSITFALEHAGGRLKGKAIAERDGQTRTALVDAGRVK